MLRPSIRNVLISITAILCFVAISVPVHEVTRSLQQRSAAQSLAADAATDHSLFLSRTDFRFEWGFSGVALADEPEAVRTYYRDLIIRRRPQLDANVAATLAGLSAAFEPAFKQAVRALAASVEAWKRLRPEVDAAIERPLSARDQTLPKRLTELGSEVTQRLEALTALLEKRMRILDPGMGSMLDASAAVWLARTSSGTEGVTLYNAVVNHRSMTEVERKDLRTVRTRAATAWMMAGQTLSAANAPDAVLAAYRAAEDGYFGGAFNTLRTGLIAMIADGGDQLPDAETKTWEQGQVAGLMRIDETAIAIIKAIGVEAKLRAAEAQRSFEVYLTVALAALALSSAAAWIIHFRVVHGLTQLSAAMRAISEGAADTRVPGLGRSDEIGAMAATVQIFRDNLIRAPQVEGEVAEARQASETQLLKS